MALQKGQKVAVAIKISNIYIIYWQDFAVDQVKVLLNHNGARGTITVISRLKMVAFNCCRHPRKCPQKWRRENKRLLKRKQDQIPIWRCCPQISSGCDTDSILSVVISLPLKVVRVDFLHLEKKNGGFEYISFKTDHSTWYI